MEESWEKLQRFAGSTLNTDDPLWPCRTLETTSLQPSSRNHWEVGSVLSFPEICMKRSRIFPHFSEKKLIWPHWRMFGKRPYTFVYDCMKPTTKIFSSRYRISVGENHVSRFVSITESNIELIIYIKQDLYLRLRCRLHRLVANHWSLSTMLLTID